MEELTRIETAIAAARQEPQKQPETVAETEPQWIASAPVSAISEPPRSVPPPTQPSLPVYTPFVFSGIKGTPDDFHLPPADSAIIALVEAVTSKEGPISMGLLSRRVAEHWGITRVTARAVKRVDGQVRKANVKMTADDGKVFVWPAEQVPKEYAVFRVPGDYDLSKRDAEDLSPIEVANGALYLLEQHVSLPVTDLVRETARLFGYSRLGQNVDRVMKSGIEVLVWSGRAKEDGGVVIVK